MNHSNTDTTINSCVLKRNTETITLKTLKVTIDTLFQQPLTSITTNCYHVAVDSHLLPLTQPMSSSSDPLVKLLRKSCTCGQGECRVSLKWLAISSYTRWTFSTSNCAAIWESQLLRLEVFTSLTFCWMSHNSGNLQLHVGTVWIFLKVHNKRTPSRCTVRPWTVGTISVILEVIPCVQPYQYGSAW